MDAKRLREKGYSRAAGKPKKRKSPNPHLAEQDTSYVSASAKKLKGTRCLLPAITPGFAYCILEFVSVFAAISENLVCKTCHGKVQFLRTAKQGLGFTLVMQCKKCEDKFVQSCPRINRANDINRRIVFVFRLMGLGLDSVNKFCGLMDICSGIAKNTYYACLDNVTSAASTVFDIVLNVAVDEEKQLNVEHGEPMNHLIVSGDGTWKKRGFTSLFGVSTLIGIYSGKTVDANVKCSFCQSCVQKKTLRDENIDEYDSWYEEHKKNCPINHSGSSGKMEIDGITEMFERSVAKHGVKYARYVGDGDSKTFKGILTSNPYGDELIVEKKECVGHVEKRMGTRLRNFKKANKGVGGKGKGKLTDKVIGELTKFYGLAIRRNSDSVDKMRKEIWASLEHCSSSDEKPQHSKCPPGEKSWCQWRQAEAAGTLADFTHKRVPIDLTIAEQLKPIYEDLSKDSLLERCLGAYTQNNNESLNSCIWIMAPKHLHSGKAVVDVATYLAVIMFNEGFTGILKTMNVLGITVGPEAEAYAARLDGERIQRSERRVSDAAKNARIVNREEEIANRERQHDEEGELYGPGIAD